ncbi:putative ATP-dependent RNA helicase DDX1 [Apostichopus japonicus]|uniref:Putative ATP-dependent RNA helicase DDX1 n=1 Tax=Stichopus japonicus TaxID=307972 RepID=A0A2G8KGC2_STIJA|nr:putative ATP-dependent RNA helicase DDX1 [Apostichopus japonicus]
MTGSSWQTRQGVNKSTLPNSPIRSVCRRDKVSVTYRCSVRSHTTDPRRGRCTHGGRGTITPETPPKGLGSHYHSSRHSNIPEHIPAMLIIDKTLAAETGSGKTGAFCLPVIQIVHETLREKAEGKSASKVTAPKADSTNWRMNIYDRGESMAIDKEGLLCQSREHHSWYGTRSNKGVSNRGKYYYEATVTDEGLCRVGWATAKAKLDLGTCKDGFGFGGTGKKSFGRQFDTYGEPYGMGDTIGCFLDLDAGVISYSKNGIDLGQAFAIPGHLQKQTFFAAVVLKNAEMKFNFGSFTFKHQPSNGYVGLSESDPSCVSPSPIHGGGAVQSSKAAPNAPMAIIIEPSRELAEQQIATNRNHSILRTSDRLQLAVPEKPTIAYRRPRNLRDLLVRAAVPLTSYPTPIQHGTFKCDRTSRCIVCSHHIVESNSINSHTR